MNPSELELFKRLKEAEEPQGEFEAQEIVASRAEPANIVVPPVQSNEPMDLEPLPETVDVPELQMPKTNVDYDRAKAESDRLNQYSNLLRGFQGVIQGSVAGVNPNFRADMGVADNLAMQGKQALDQYYAKAKNTRDQGDWEAKLKDTNLDLTNKEKLMDPNSAESLFAQDYMIQMHPEMNVDSIRAQNAWNLYRMSPQMQKMVSNMLRERQLGIQEESLRVRKEQGGRRLDQGDKKLGLDTDKFAHQVEEGEQVSDKQTEAITALDTSLDLIGKSQDLYNRVRSKMGKYASNIESAKRYIPGFDKDPDFVELNQYTGAQAAEYIKSISGAAVSDQERAELLKNIPNIEDTPREFERKASVWKRILGDKRNILIEGIRKQGKKGVERFVDPSTGKNLKGQFENDNTVMLESPDGERVRVKKDAAQKYIDKGAKVIK